MSKGWQRLVDPWRYAVEGGSPPFERLDAKLNQLEPLPAGHGVLDSLAPTVLELLRWRRDEAERYDLENEARDRVEPGLSSLSASRSSMRSSTAASTSGPPGSE